MNNTSKEFSISLILLSRLDEDLFILLTSPSKNHFCSKQLSLQKKKDFWLSSRI